MQGYSEFLNRLKDKGILLPARNNYKKELRAEVPISKRPDKII